MSILKAVEIPKPRPRAKDTVFPWDMRRRAGRKGRRKDNRVTTPTT